MDNITQPPHEKTCCTPREHVLLFAEIAATAAYDADFRRLIPFARRLLFGAEDAR